MSHFEKKSINNITLYSVWYIPRNSEELYLFMSHCTDFCINKCQGFSCWGICGFLSLCLYWQNNQLLMLWARNRWAKPVLSSLAASISKIKICSVQFRNSALLNFSNNYSPSLKVNTKKLCIKRVSRIWKWTR